MSGRRVRGRVGREEGGEESEGEGGREEGGQERGGGGSKRKRNSRRPRVRGTGGMRTLSS